MGELGQGFWRQLLICKYKLGIGGWFIPRQDQRVLGLWKSVLFVQVEFDSCIRYGVWCGGQLLLYNQFPNLYLLERRQQTFVAENYCTMGGDIVWDFSFQRNLIDREVSDLADLLGILDKVYLSDGGTDEKLWKPDVKGQLSFKSFYNVLYDIFGQVGGWQFFSDPFVPLRALVFCWVARFI